MIGSIDSLSMYSRQFSMLIHGQIAGAISFGQNFNGLKGGEQHPWIKAVKSSVDLVGTFMYIPWLAKFLRNFRPSQAVKKSRMKTMQVKSFGFGDSNRRSSPEMLWTASDSMTTNGKLDERS
jgi:hypothetical protein